MELLDQFFQDYPGPFLVRRKPSKRRGDVRGFDILCRGSNTPIAFTDASMFLDPAGAELTAEVFARYLNLNHPIEI